MINIKIDLALTSYLSANKIKLDELFIIVCFCQNRMDLLRNYLMGRNGDQCTAYLASLERKQFLRTIITTEDFSWDNYEITSLGVDIYNETSRYVTDMKEITALLSHTVPPPIVGNMTNGDQFSEFLDAFVEKFPEGVRNGAGLYLRTSKVDIEKKMRQFINKYKYDQDTILTATQNYIDNMKKSSYQYCNQAHFFIMKDGISKLSTECESIGKVDQGRAGWDIVA